MLPFIVQTVVMKYGGKIWDNPAFGKDGSILLTPVTFPTPYAREKACTEIENEIEKVVKQQRPISVTPVDGSEEQFELRLNIKFMFAQFQEIMENVNPAFEFIESNGGWLDTKTGKFPGFDALENARKNNTLDEKQAKEIEDALAVFGKFMASYFLGSKLIDENTFNIVPHNQ